MSKQSEAVLEENLLKQLTSLGYEKVLINYEMVLLANLKAQLGNTKLRYRDWETDRKSVV